MARAGLTPDPTPPAERRWFFCDGGHLYSPSLLFFLLTLKEDEAAYRRRKRR